ncbi:recombinase zinc beta ribbon domain-containing protein [Catellatospora coxensis]
MMESGRAGSRTGNEPNTHPATKHTYSLRSYVRCPECHRRMVGKDNNGRRYLTCRGPRNSDDQLTDRAPQHPGTVYIREESILAAVNDVINRRVFGPERAQLLAEQLAAAPAALHAQHLAALEAAQRRLADIERRQRSLTLDLEDADPADRAWRDQLRNRHRELETERLDVADRIGALQAKILDSPQQDTELLDTIPTTEINLAEMPIELQRQLYDALRLQVIMTSRTAATIKITLAGDGPAEAAIIARQDQQFAFDNADTAVDPHPHKRADAGRPLCVEEGALLNASRARPTITPKRRAAKSTAGLPRRPRRRSSRAASCSTASGSPVRQPATTPLSREASRRSGAVASARSASSSPPPGYRRTFAATLAARIQDSRSGSHSASAISTGMPAVSQASTVARFAMASCWSRPASAIEFAALAALPNGAPTSSPTSGIRPARACASAMSAARFTPALSSFRPGTASFSTSWYSVIAAQIQTALQTRAARSAMICRVNRHGFSA